MRPRHLCSNIVALWSVLLLPAASVVHAAASYDPSHTTVAVLPSVNLAPMRHPDKDQPAHTKQADEATSAVRNNFTSHGFSLADQAAVSAAVQQSSLDFTQPSSWTADHFVAIGKAVNADLVTLVVITDTHQGFRHGLLAQAEREGEAKTKCFLVDVKTGTVLIDGTPAAGKARAGAMKGWLTSGIGEGSSSYVVKAVDDAVEKSLHDFLASYTVSAR